MKIKIIAGLLAAVMAYALFAFKQTGQTPEKQISQTLTAQVDTLNAAVAQLQRAISHNADSKQLQQLFLKTRLAYKKIEWAAEYFTPTVTRVVNGPPVPEVENAGLIYPRGLQVMETYLFPGWHLSNKKALLKELRLLKDNCNKYKAYFQHVELYNWQLFDAGKQEVFRVLTLGITGFDDPLSLHSMQESAAALSSLKAVFASYNYTGDKDDVNARLFAAIAYLQKNQNFNAFNRAEFITGYGNRLSAAITRLQQQLKLPVVKYNRLLNQDAATLFDKAAFNPNAYAASLNEPSAKRIALGKKLFADPNISGTGTRSCASCHQPEKAFTDGLVKNTVLNSTLSLARNTPTLINAALQPAQFYDMRVGTLEEQVLDVMQNKDEMHGSITKLSSKLWQDNAYQQLFAEAYVKKDRKEIDTLEVMDAIAAYVRSLTLLNSRFDDYMRGDKRAMSEREVKGFNLFMGKAKCATCHYMPLFNGTLPPKYLATEAEVIGVPKVANMKVIDPDLGLFNIIPQPFYRNAFKIPTIRNAAKTAPYMHNGAFATLNEVMDFYNKGGGVGMGIKINNQTLSPGKLNLSPAEVEDVVAFIRALDSRY